MDDLRMAAESAYKAIQEIETLIERQQDSILSEKFNEILLERQPKWAMWVLKDHFKTDNKMLEQATGCSMSGLDKLNIRGES